jgi:hypothetical protein
MQFVMLVGRGASSANRGGAGVLVDRKCVGQDNNSLLILTIPAPLATTAVPPGIRF